MPANLSTYISTPQAAQALGVSVSTVKRWVDDGRLPAHKTAGGHRKLLRAEVLELARNGELPRQDLTELYPAIGSARQLDDRSLSSALHHSLMAREPGETRALIRRAYRSGMPLESFADQVLSPVMRRIGHDWETCHIDVWQEHYSSQACIAALHELLSDVGHRAGRDRPTAIGATPPGDFYQLPTLLAQLVLMDAGWNAVNLGTNTPFPNLLNAARQLKPRLIWLSVSHVSDAPSFMRDYRALYREVQQMGIAVAIGGFALNDALRAQLPYTTYGDGLTHLADFARKLHSRPRPPRRGRPPKSNAARPG